MQGVVVGGRQGGRLDFTVEGWDHTHARARTHTHTHTHTHASRFLRGGRLEGLDAKIERIAGAVGVRASPAVRPPRRAAPRADSRRKTDQKSRI